MQVHRATITIGNERFAFQSADDFIREQSERHGKPNAPVPHPAGAPAASADGTMSPVAPAGFDLCPFHTTPIAPRGH